jgi:predicted O-methyltransferase YrrM
MKLFGAESHATIDMAADPALREHLVGLIAHHRIDVAIETGTFIGLGSTRLVAEAFLRVAPPKRFATVEVNFANWCRAKANLRPYPFVDCRWGLSVGLDRALNFLRHDDMLTNHRRYPEIYIDNVTDPVGAYTRELLGQAVELERMPLTASGAAIQFSGKDFLY